MNAIPATSSLRPRPERGQASLPIARLLADYRAGRRRPYHVAMQLCKRIEPAHEPVWITRVTPEQLLDDACRLDDADLELPLYGIPFAVKDNIDVAG